MFCYVLVCPNNVLDWFDSTNINIQTFVTPKKEETEETEEIQESMLPVAADDGTSDINLTAQLNEAGRNKYDNTRIQIGGSKVGTIIHITENDFVNIPTDDKLTITGNDSSPVTLPGTFTFYPETTYDHHKDPKLLSQLKDGEILLIGKNRNGDRLIYAYNTENRKKRILKIIREQEGGYKKHKKTQTRLNTRKKRKNNNKKKRTIRKIIKK
jgi:hypothetical protein